MKKIQLEEKNSCHLGYKFFNKDYLSLKID